MKNIGRRKFITSLTAAGVGMSTLRSLSSISRLDNEIKRIGIIGLDTSQDTMIISHINNLKGDGFDVVQPIFGEDVAGFKVVAAFPYGSRKIESSIKQIPTYVKRMKEVGVEIVDSIDTLLSKVDAVLLMTFDGHPRLEQALQVIKAGKPIFVNKPFAASLKDGSCNYSGFKTVQFSNLFIFSNAVFEGSTGCPCRNDWRNHGC